MANSSDLLAAMLDRTGRSAPAEHAACLAGFRHLPARRDFERMMLLLDQVRSRPEEGNAGPAFFSSNIASLSRTLERVRAVDTIVQDDGARLRQTVVYRLR